jgi:two-component system, NtrC family, sensor kinase
MNPVLPDAEPAALPVRKSLRAKGFIATVALMAYLLGSLVYVSIERARLYDNIQTLQQLSRHEKALALTEASVSGVVADLNQARHAILPQPTVPAEIRLYMEECAKLFAALGEFDPGYALLQRAIERSYTQLEAAPVAAHWTDLREALGRASDDLEIRRRSLVERRDDLTLMYQRQFDAVTVESLLLALLGIAVFGALVAWFFSGLTGDIRRLESHARQIVHGSRGVALPVSRDDELGRLMRAVNQMGADLDQREKQIAIDGQRRSHQDKMQAVGALAAGLAHEVNNPLAVIAGVAQELSPLEGSIPAQRIAESVRLILAQTERAARAARDLAELAAPQPTDFDWVDINAMVRRVLQLMGYDKRYRNIVFERDLAGDVPAVRAPGALVQQVLMQVMSLGCEAMAALPRSESLVRVLTRSRGAAVDMHLAFPVRLDLTDAEVQRVLLLSRAMIEPLGGRFALGQEAGPVLSVTLSWSVESGGR